jgi:hypothetical protein
MLLQMFVVLFVAFVLVRRGGWELSRVESREEGWNTRNIRCENDTNLTYRENTYLADRFTNRQKSWDRSVKNYETDRFGAYLVCLRP